MSRRLVEILVLIGLVVLTTFVYVGRHAGWLSPFRFSTTGSWVVIILIVLSLVWILIRTMRGKPAGRRTVFLYIGIAVALPLMMSLTQTISTSPETQQLMEGLTAVPPGSKVLAAFDYDPSSAPELQPMAETFIKYCIDHDLKIIFMGLWPQGPQQANLAVQTVLRDSLYHNRKFEYGTDWVNLGYQTGNEFVIQRMGSDFRSMFPADNRGTPYDKLPILAGVRNFSNVAYCFNLSAGYPGTKEWVLIGVDRFGLKIGAGNTAVQATGMYPYVRSGQLKGILGGMNGAAEFERATDRIGKGTKFMLSQSFGHMVVIAFIIIGNVAFFMHERRRK